MNRFADVVVDSSALPHGLYDRSKIVVPPSFTPGGGSAAVGKSCDGFPAGHCAGRGASGAGDYEAQAGSPGKRAVLRRADRADRFRRLYDRAACRGRLSARRKLLLLCRAVLFPAVPRLEHEKRAVAV